MLTLKKIEMGPAYHHGYANGATPGMACSVDFQVGEKSYDTITVKLPRDAVARIAAAIVAEATALLVCEGPVDIDGAPGVEPGPETEAAAEIEPL